ncbi:precorrin-6A reductase [Tateyamaria omphalii]|uniref:precorrin-6A/cobalt-precorrin-6A reductase n=1 Tax=Tateyamaria omphalii TaxID=299262 RepID=UPI0016744C55|nr:precorrin-6A/cobalt-precorrin-6A reductase [Tateyamaria omphalii]GGX61641.1 precorrin-6A reductase [Tateyamaria omphalii]
MKRVLVLGGSAVTEPAVRALQAAGHEVQVYWSRAPMVADLPCSATLRAGVQSAEAIVDATHPFDETLRAISARLSPDVPRVRVGRGAWVPDAEDQWQQVDTLAQAVAALPSGARVFAASGRDSAEVLVHHDGPVFLRQLHRHDDPAPEGCTYVFGDGPFDAAQEAALFKELKIDVVLARNTGGKRAFPKIAAARLLGLPVVLIAQPGTGAVTLMSDTGALLAWVDHL